MKRGLSLALVLGGEGRVRGNPSGHETGTGRETGTQLVSLSLAPGDETGTQLVSLPQAGTIIRLAPVLGNIMREGDTSAPPAHLRIGRFFRPYGALVGG